MLLWFPGCYIEYFLYFRQHLTVDIFNINTFEHEKLVLMHNFVFRRAPWPLPPCPAWTPTPSNSVDTHTSLISKIELLYIYYSALFYSSIWFIKYFLRSPNRKRAVDSSGNNITSGEYFLSYKFKPSREAHQVFTFKFNFQETSCLYLSPSARVHFAKK
jgi:hypothetical protein